MTKIAVSSGDPAGIGPDICIKAFGNKKPLSYKPIVFGNINLFLERAAKINQEISPLRDKYFDLIDNPKLIEDTLEAGETLAREEANKNLEQIKEKIGI